MICLYTQIKTNAIYTGLYAMILTMFLQRRSTKTNDIMACITWIVISHMYTFTLFYPYHYRIKLA